MDGSHEQSTATVGVPVANIAVKASQYYRLLSGMKHLPHSDVIFYLMHEFWSPDQRNTFDNIACTRVFRLFGDLKAANHVFDYRNVENTSFISREPSDVAKLLDLVRTELSRFNVSANDIVIEINGMTYACVGRDQGSAKLLFSILSCSVSDDQIAHLKQDVIANGALSRIILDHDYENKLSLLNGLFFDKVRHFAEFFKLYFSDPMLRYASALLLFETDITDEILRNFGGDNTDEIREIAINELSIEDVQPVVGAGCLATLYNDGTSHRDPWINLPNYKKIIGDKIDTNSEQFDSSVNNLVGMFSEQVENLVDDATSLLASSLISASRDFSHDFSHIQLQEFGKKYKKEINRKCPVFIAGVNRRTTFQFLPKEVFKLHICRTDSTFFSAVGPDQVDALVYNDPNNYGTTLINEAANSVFVVDSVSSFEKKIMTATYTLPKNEYQGASMSRCFSLVRNLLGKPKNMSTIDFHNTRLPLMMVLRFVPYFGVETDNARFELNALSHHYDMRFLPPVDFTGLEITIHLVKRDIPIAKQHDKFSQPYNVMSAYVKHVFAIRYLLINGIVSHRFYWKCLAPLRMLSRYYGVGAKARFKLQSLVDFSDWGGVNEINDFNNLFSDYVSPSVFGERVVASHLRTKGKHKKVRDQGAKC